MDGLPVWHEAIAGRVNRTPDLRICGKAASEQAAFAKVRRLHPKLVLTEIFRPQDLGFIRELHRRHPRLPILVFSFRDEEVYASQALHAGARGYLSKTTNGDALVAGIRKALKGAVVLSPAMTARLRQQGGSGRKISSVFC